MSDRTISSFGIPQQLLRQLKETLGHENKSISRWVEEQAEAYVKAHGSGNPSVPLDRFLENPAYRAVPTLLTMAGYNWSLLDRDTLKEVRANITRELPRINARIPPTEVNTT